MKLSELIAVLEPKTDVTFEIKETTYPSGFYAEDILKAYPNASDYKVTALDTGYYNDEEGKVVSTLMIEVSNEEEEQQ